MAARRPSHVAMAPARREAKTTANDADVESFLAAVDLEVLAAIVRRSFAALDDSLSRERGTEKDR